MNKEGDPTSAIADRMLHVDIPEGTVLHEAEIREGDVQKKFGVSHMTQGMIAHSSGEKTEGTVLWFNGGTFRVDVDRRDLTAEPINRINELCRELEKLAVIFRHLPTQIKGAEELAKDLTVSQDIFRDSAESFKSFDPSKAVTELGALISTMKSSNIELHEKWRTTITELSSLGVTSIWDQHGGPLNSVAVEKMAQGFAAGTKEAE